EELPRARFRDRPEIGDHLVAAHPDAVIGDGEDPCRRIVIDVDLRLEVVFEQRLVVQRFEAQLVAGIRRVRDQFAQEDLAIRVQRMDHELQELPDLGLEAEGLAVDFCSGWFGHGTTPSNGDSFILAPGSVILSPAPGPGPYARWPAARIACRYQRMNASTLYSLRSDSGPGTKPTDSTP